MKVRKIMSQKIRISKGKSNKRTVKNCFLSPLLSRSKKYRTKNYYLQFFVHYKFYFPKNFIILSINPSSFPLSEESMPDILVTFSFSFSVSGDKGAFDKYFS